MKRTNWTIVGFMGTMLFGYVLCFALVTSTEAKCIDSEYCTDGTGQYSCHGKTVAPCGLYGCLSATQNYDCSTCRCKDILLIGTLCNCKHDPRLE